MNADILCTICNSGGHRPSRCPDIRDPLKEGFYSGGGGGGGHSHDDDDDESLTVNALPNDTPPLQLGPSNMKLASQ